MFPDFNFISQGYEYGDDLAVEADLSVKLNAELDIRSEFPHGYLTNTISLVPPNSSFPMCNGVGIRIPKEM